MLKLSTLEFFLRLIPESLLFILAAYTFSKTKINWKRYFISSFMLMGVIFIVRFLPINYGVHTFMNIIMLTIIVTVVNKIDIIKAVKCALVTTIMLFVCEGINILFLMVLWKDDFINQMNNAKISVIYSIPSLVVFTIIVLGYYLNLKGKGKLQDV